MDGDRHRVGYGFDVHALALTGGRPLVLGGVRFDGPIRLIGHSDADVVAHACIDAILGAARAGDIGVLYPDHEAATAGADSIEMLREVVATVAALGWRPVNVDCTVVLDEPKLAPRRDEMVGRLSDALGAPVWLKGKRTEGIPGLAGGIHCHAVALLERM